MWCNRGKNWPSEKQNNCEVIQSKIIIVFSQITFCIMTTIYRLLILHSFKIKKKIYLKTSVVFLLKLFFFYRIFKHIFLLNDYLCINNHVNLIFKTIWAKHFFRAKIVWYFEYQKSRLCFIFRLRTQTKKKYIIYDVMNLLIHFSSLEQ